MSDTRIISLIYHPPAYSNLGSGQRFQHWVETPGGGWVGTEGMEWPDLLGYALLRQRNDVVYEVWQPDTRANRMVSWQLADRLTHTLFPAKECLAFHGLKPERYAWSWELDRLLAGAPTSAIVHVNNPFATLSQRLIRRYRQRRYLLEVHGANLDVTREKYRLHRNMPVSLLYWRWESSIRRLRRKVVVYKNSRNAGFLQGCGAMRCERVPMGCDFGVFTPGSKREAQAALGVPPGTCVLSMASRFVALKQIDRVISVLAKLPNELRFCLLLAGHGDKEYTRYLQTLAAQLLPSAKVRFLGFLDGLGQRTLFRASDLFICASTSEGASVSVMKALACETPVFCTRVGGVDDLLAEHGAGLLPDRFDYETWERHLSAVTRGLQVPVLPRRVAVSHFDWPCVAERFLRLYDALLNSEV